MTDTLENLTFTDWCLVIHVLVIWLWLGMCAWRWLLLQVFRFVKGRTVKGRVENAFNEIIDASGLNTGQKMTLSDDGWYVVVGRTEAVKHE